MMDSEFGLLQCHQQQIRSRYRYSLQQLRLLHPLPALYSGLVDPLAPTRLSLGKAHHIFHWGYLGNQTSLTAACQLQPVSTDSSPDNDNDSDTPRHTDGGKQLQFLATPKLRLIFIIQKQTLFHTSYSHMYIYKVFFIITCMLCTFCWF